MRQHNAWFDPYVVCFFDSNKTSSSSVHFVNSSISSLIGILLLPSIVLALAPVRLLSLRRTFRPFLPWGMRIACLR
jgi:hypothetical protein